MSGTIFALIPPIVAIALALITKEVYLSLLIGILSGAFLFTGLNPVHAVETVISIMGDKIGGNVNILLFLSFLGIVVALITKSGASRAYGEWAARSIKSRRGALLATMFLGSLIFVDDYFNCLTVGSVMRPVTDKHNVSRAKLAYLIDATAAPVCMIAPISSWAAAVAGVVEGTDGLTLFISAIPYNLYSLLTIAAIIIISCFDIDFGLMKKHEDNAKKGDLFTSGERVADDGAFNAVTDKGKVIDLAFPVIVLIACCIIGMIYTGGFFEGESFVNSFANCDAPTGLSMGSVAALLITVIFYLIRRVLTFKDCMEAFPEGFKAMISPILILTFAWTLSGLTGNLGAAEYVSGIFEGSAAGLTGMLPAIVFLVAIFLAFSTGTSWGTFGILLPIVVGINLPGNLLIITIAACLAGAVCGDHCSPISDTTIMASAGAQCDHINHVSTQIPYVLCVAGCCVIGYLAAGITQNGWIGTLTGLLVLAVVLVILDRKNNPKFAARR